MATLFANPRFTPVDAQGDPYPGATLTFYAAGTTTPQPVYTTSALTTPHPNPVTANAAGQFPAIYYDDALQYRAILRDATNVLLWDVDVINSQLTAEEIGRALYPRSAAEIAGGITPTNYRRNYGDVRRYGAVGNGIFNDGAALQAAHTAAGVDGRVVYDSGSYTTSTPILVPQGQCIEFIDATLTLTATSGNLFEATSPAYPGRIMFKNAVLRGPGAATSTRGISVDGNSPFTLVGACDIRNFGIGVYLRDSYCSTVEDSLIAGCGHGIWIERESHAFTAKNNFVTDCTIVAMSCNYGGSTIPTHNITFTGGAYQRSPWGIWIENAYEPVLVGVYVEINTVGDLRLGVADAGVYARAVYNATVETLHVSSNPSGPNIILEHCVGFDLRGLGFATPSSTTATLVRVDGFSDQGRVLFHRWTTLTPTSTAPVDLQGLSANRVVVGRVGREVYPSGMTDAIRFGNLGTQTGRVYSTNSGGRDQLTIEATNDDIYQRVPDGVAYIADASNVLFGVDGLNAITTGQTNMLVRYSPTGTPTFQRVTVGATDSGGTGFRVLRVPN